MAVWTKDITLGQYAYRDSSLHKLDPRTKLVASLALMIGLMVTKSWPILVLFLIFWVFIVRVSKLGYGLAARNLRPFVWLLLLTILAQAFFADGRIIAIVPLIGLKVTREGLGLGLIYAFRLGLLIVYAALLTLTTAPMELADGLEGLLRPLRRLRVPVHELVMMMSLSLRFVPTLINEAERIRNAQLSRGARFGGTIGNRIRGLMPLVVPLFLSAFRRAEELALAMEARCYRGGEGRTSYKRLHFRASDYISLSLAASLLLVACLWAGVR